MIHVCRRTNASIIILSKELSDKLFPVWLLPCPLNPHCNIPCSKIIVLTINLFSSRYRALNCLLNHCCSKPKPSLFLLWILPCRCLNSSASIRPPFRVNPWEYLLRLSSILICILYEHGQSVSECSCNRIVYSSIAIIVVLVWLLKIIGAALDSPLNFFKV